ncbi:hypothetical protein GUJ93_ZPchr0014g47440 [Zizania palustris]|uniref:ELMO domain-containing protein n=1 Tax=Zizania palustris TaxID=103762 RepID=A0A8J5T8J4_ZIZPA|nr:hypothetical protein GUJ93_ZPchr0014g47440 [Zizania palustris]
MQPPCLGACGGRLGLPLHGHRLSSASASSSSSASRAAVSCAAGGGKASSRGKENVWSVDNDRAAAKDARGQKHRRRRRPVGRRLPPSPPPPGRRKGKDASLRVRVSGAMLMEVETVLQTQEPVIRPSWDTFASSLSGIWKGVGAVFSPITAEMEPIGVGSKEEYLYDCYTLSHIERHYDSDYGSVIRRKTNWTQLNPHGEAEKQSARYDGGDHNNYSDQRIVDLPSHESFDLKGGDVLDEDSIAQEPGIVYFEDGSYSRGPVDLAIDEYDESKYFLSPTYKFEQCLVKGCHKRLRIVHTIEFNEGGANIQIVRIAVYEEKWVSPAHIHVEDDTPVDLKPLSQRKRTKPSELTGSWKVYELRPHARPTSGSARLPIQTSRTKDSGAARREANPVIRSWDLALACIVLEAAASCLPHAPAQPWVPARIAARRQQERGREGEEGERGAGAGAQRRQRGMDRNVGSFVAVRRHSGASCHHPSPAEVVSGSTAWIGRGFACVCAQRRESHERISFDLSPAQEECLQRLQNRIEVPYDSSNGTHQEALKALWHVSFPGTELLGLISDQWKEMGWQGKDPSTDFRGGGFISLENLLYFATNYTKSFQELLCKQNGDRALWEYPFAVAGVNITFMLIQMLDLQAGLLIYFLSNVF